MGTVVDLKAYWEQVSRFSQYPEDKRADGYALGLLAEAGEVCGVVDKWLRNKYDEAEMKRRLVDELGDLMWYFTAWKALEPVNLGMPNNLTCSDISLGVGLTFRFVNSIRDVMTYGIDWTFLELVLDCCKQCDTTLQTVLDANVAKLTERHG